MRKSLWGLVIALTLMFFSFNSVEASTGKTSGDVKPQTSAGVAHTATIKSDGTLWAWGYNSNGQVGDGTSVNKTSPVQIGADNNWATVSAGQYFTTAIKSDGTLWAWGLNTFGQLGDGTIVSKTTPIQIGSDTKWVTIATGDSHTIAIKSDGTLWAWGLNSNGQLGNGTTIDKHSPTQVGTDAKWVAVAAGYQDTLAIKSDGTLWAWGKNTFGQLGDGSTTTRTSPVKIGTDTNWASVSTKQDHTLAIKSDGTLWAWGYNGNGQLGDGTTVNKTSPTQIGTDNTWVSVKAGGSHTRALKSDGTLWAWGWNNAGQLGDGTVVQKTSPVQIGADNTWVSISTGSSFSVALKSDGTLWTCGANMSGQVGDGTTVNKTSAVQIGTFGMNEKVSAGDVHNVALNSDGTLWAWGRNWYGQLGDGTIANKTSPVQIGTDNKWVSISAGCDHTIAIKSGGTLWAWGGSYDGQLGDGTNVDKTSPVQIGTDNKWVSILAGCQHSLALKSDGTLWAWGYNVYGQVGDGTSVNKASPVQIGADNKWVSIGTSYYHSVALKSDGTLWAWGYNGDGELGIGNSTGPELCSSDACSTSPVQIGSDNNWVSISAGGRYSTALKSDGTLWAWGGNYYGELGDGTTIDKHSPVQIGIDNKWVSISTGYDHTIALKSDGTLWAWGSNEYGKLGDGTNVDKTSPVKIGTDNNWISIDAGGYHSTAIKSDRTFWIWGWNFIGLIDGSQLNSNVSPIQVVFSTSDTSAPAVTITSPTSSPTYGTGTSTVTLGGSATDSVGVTSVTWSNDRGGNGSCTGTTAWSCSGITLYEGVNNLTVSASDLANNVGTDIIEVNYSSADVTAPTVTINSPTVSATLITSVTPLTLGGSAGDAVGVTSITWSNDRGGSGTCTGTTSWSCSGIALYEGVNNLTVLASDLANNVGTDVIVVSYSTSDITPPSVNLTSPANCKTDVTGAGTISVAGSAYDAVGVTSVTWVNDRGGSGTCTGTTSWVCGSIALSAGVNRITVTAKDVANNAGTDYIDITYTTASSDTTPPTGTMTAVSGQMSTTYTVTLALTCSDSGSGCGYMQFSKDNSAWFGWEAFSTTRTITFPVSGQKTIYARFKDNAGNVSQTYSSTMQSVPFGSINVMNKSNAGAKNTASLSMSCLGTGGCTYMQFSKDNTTWTNWESFNSSRTVSMPDGAGAKTVYVKFKDSAGVVSNPHAVSTFFGMPGSVTINKADASTTSLNVSLMLTCQDSQGGVCSQMRFSKDNVTWYGWETFNVSRSVMLAPAGAGTKNIYVQFKDNAGNTSAVFSDSITYAP